MIKYLFSREDAAARTSVDGDDEEREKKREYWMEVKIKTCEHAMFFLLY